MNVASKRIVVLVAFTAIFFPVLLRILRSPITLILLSPLIILAILVGLLIGTLILANTLDSRSSAHPSADPLKYATRPLAFATPAAWEATVTRSSWTTNIESLPPLVPTYPSLSSSLNSLLHLLTQNYILPWYSNLSSSPSFPAALEATIHSSLRSIVARVSSQDVLSILVRRILPIITAHIDKFGKAEMSLRGAELERRLTQSDELDLMLAARYAVLGGNLHPAVGNIAGLMTRQSEEAHLRGLVEKVLLLVMPENEVNSEGVKIIAREIVTCVIALPMIDMLADPDFWNRLLDQLASAAIQQQKLISKVRHIVETQSSRPLPTASPMSTSGRLRMEDITSRTDPKHFESFLKSISRADSLLDVRRLKNDVLSEIRRTRTLLADHENEDWINGEKTEGIVKYLDRLYTGKRQVEQRIAILGGADNSTTLHDQLSTPTALSLRAVLSNPSSLSYFMEFMDRRSKSLPVQFWLTVESFKDPLESINTDSESSSGEEVVRPRSETVREDMAMIHSLYFSSPTPVPALSAISQRHRDTIRAFMSSDEPASAKDEKKVRRSVLLAQRQIETDMEGDFEDFKRSELWFKAVADIQGGGAAAADEIVSPVRHREKSPPGLYQRFSAPAGGLRTTSNRPTDQEDIVVKRRRVLPSFILPPAKMTRTETSPAIPSPMYRNMLHQRRDSGDSSDSFTPSFDSTQSEGPRHVPSNLDLLIGPPDASAASRAPLFDDPRSPSVTHPQGEEGTVESETIEAIQAALTDMIADEKRLSNRKRDSYMNSSRVSVDSSSRRGDLAQDDMDDGSPARPDPEEDWATSSNQRHAVPGDLQLGREIARLGDKITNLRTQENILDALIRKAELTGDAQELKLLNRSKSAMTRELRELTFQRDQYVQQDAENALGPDRTKVAIASSVTSEEEGKQVVKYVIEVQQLAQDGTVSSGWVTARRYSEFWALHQRLRERFSAVRALDLPGKKLVTSTSTSFIDSRRLALEKYLRSLITISLVCESEDLRAFLSRETKFDTSLPPVNARSTPSFLGQDIMRTMYRSVAESIDDMFFGPSMLDVMIQRLTQQAAEFAGIIGSGAQDEDLVDHALSGKASPEETLRKLPAGLKPLEEESSTSAFSRPICDLILAVFELNDKNNWLRRQAIVIILQQVLGSTIERKMRDTLRSQLEEPRLLSYFSIVKETIWPGGRPKPPAPPRTADERMHTREDANRKLSALMPDLAANMIGRSNARRGARRMFAVLQNRRLNQHIIYTIIDEIFSAIFPEVVTR